MTWRALYTAGMSAGEADVAAQAVTFAELHLGCGLDAVAQLPVDRPWPARVPVGLARGAVDVLVDPAGRGLLTLAPLGIGLVVARAVPTVVLVPGCAWHPVLAGVLARYARRGDPPLFALDLASDGAFAQGLCLGGDGALTLLDAGQLHDAYACNPALIQNLHGLPSGVLLLRGPTVSIPGGLPSHPRVLLAGQRSAALTGGLTVGAAPWSSVYQAASRYLVPEP